MENEYTEFRFSEILGEKDLYIINIKERWKLCNVRGILME